MSASVRCVWSWGLFGVPDSSHHRSRSYRCQVSCLVGVDWYGWLRTGCVVLYALRSWGGLGQRGSVLSCAARGSGVACLYSW